MVKQKLTLESFITKDRSVCVRQNANFSTGGSVEDVSDKVHPKNILLAQRAIKILGMEIGGVDVIANNIDTPITETGGKIIEINSSPSLSLHVCHGQSKSKKYLLADKIIDYLFDLTRRF